MKKNNPNPLHSYVAINQQSPQLLSFLGLSVALSFIPISPAYAAGVVGNGTAASCTENALNRALNGGGVVTFNCGAAPVTITFSTEKVISVNTTIDGGNSVILSGNNTQRLFNIAPSTPFTIKNLSLINARTAGQGAAINSPFQNTLTISHCRFRNNVSTQAGEYGGGAIYSGAGTLTIDKTRFTANRASIGGAIRLLNSNLTVTGSTFVNNKTINANKSGAGGAIYIDGANKDNGYITIRGSRFITNSAIAFGGAIFNNLYNNNKTTIANSIFSRNTVGGVVNGVGSGQGAAIWSNGDPAVGGGWVINSNKTTLRISNTTIADNTSAGSAGGLWVGRHPSGATVINSTISGNIATTSGGGGVVLGDAGRLVITNSTISGNKTNGTYSLGGGLWITDTGQAFITNTTIADNIANWQAGGIFGGLNVRLKNTILANNVAKNGGNAWNIKHNCFNPMTSKGNNLQFPAPKDTPCAAGIIIADPKLDVLKNNGKVRQTMALLPGSAASRRGANCPKTDQRGVARPSPIGTACDIGAFEAAF